MNLSLPLWVQMVHIGPSYIVTYIYIYISLYIHMIIYVFVVNPSAEKVTTPQPGRQGPQGAPQSIAQVGQVLDVSRLKRPEIRGHIIQGGAPVR